MSDPTSLSAAEAQAAEARARLAATAGELQARLAPGQLVEDAKRAGLNAAHAGVDHVRRNPVAAIGVAAAAGLVLGRRRIFALFRKGSTDSRKGFYP